MLLLSDVHFLMRTSVSGKNNDSQLSGKISPGHQKTGGEFPPVVHYRSLLQTQVIK